MAATKDTPKQEVFEGIRFVPTPEYQERQEKIRKLQSIYIWQNQKERLRFAPYEKNTHYRGHNRNIVLTPNQLLGAIAAAELLNQRDRMDRVNLTADVERGIAAGRLKKYAQVEPTTIDTGALSPAQIAERIFCEIRDWCSHNSQLTRRIEYATHTFSDGTKSIRPHSKMMTVLKRPLILGFVGDSGMGKDTTCEALVKDGFTFKGEHFDCIEFSSGSYYRAIATALFYDMLMRNPGIEKEDDFQEKLIERTKAILADHSNIGAYNIQISFNLNKGKAIFVYEGADCDTDKLNLARVLSQDKVSVVAGFIQVDGISRFREFVQSIISGDLPTGLSHVNLSRTVFLIQGRDYSLECIHHFEKMFRIHNEDRIEVGHRQFDFQVKKKMEKNANLTRDEAEMIVLNELLSKISLSSLREQVPF